MKKYTVSYSNEDGYDYLSCSVEVDGEEKTLIAYVNPCELHDEHGNPATIEDEETGVEWNPDIRDPEWMSYPVLKAALVKLAEDNGIDPAVIDFDEDSFGTHTFVDEEACVYTKMR